MTLIYPHPPSLDTPIARHEGTLESAVAELFELCRAAERDGTEGPHWRSAPAASPVAAPRLEELRS